MGGVDKLVRSTFYQHPAVFQHVAAVGEAQRMPDVLLDHQHRDTVVGDLPDSLDAHQAHGGQAVDRPHENTVDHILDDIEHCDLPVEPKRKGAGGWFIDIESFHPPAELSVVAACRCYFSGIGKIGL